VTDDHFQRAPVLPGIGFTKAAEDDLPWLNPKRLVLKGRREGDLARPRDGDAVSAGAEAGRAMLAPFSWRAAAKTLR